MKLRFAAISLVFASACCAKFAKTATSQVAPAANIVLPQLEVTSVKQSAPNADPNSGGIGIRADGIHAENITLHFMLGVAFNRQFAVAQVTGEPSWSATDRFDVAGKVAEADLSKLRGLSREQNAEMRAAMLRALLMERFHLRTHIVEREGPVFALVLSKGGSKLTQVTDAAPREAVVDGEHLSGVGASLAIRGKIAGHVVPMARLVAGLLSVGQLDRTVVDRTGLTGNYDYSLTWSPDHSGAPQDNGATDPNLPSLFTAIQEQLGLKLEPAKGPIKTLVIDSVDRPSETSLRVGITARN